MKNWRYRFTFAVLTIVALLSAASATAQETGFSGFLHRAGAAVTRTATSVTTPASPQQSHPSGATTNGPYYRPINPARGGTFPGIFGHYRAGVDTYPRVALTLAKFGAATPCWTVQATIWRSDKAHSEETFEICNAVVPAIDDLGNPTAVNPAEGTVLANALLQAQNVEGSSHARSISERTTGPLPPLMLFQVQATGPNAFPFSIQYRAILFRLAWLSGFIDQSSPSITSTIGKTMWTRFDPAGNLDRDRSAP